MGIGRRLVSISNPPSRVHLLLAGSASSDVAGAISALLLLVLLPMLLQPTLLSQVTGDSSTFAYRHRCLPLPCMDLTTSRYLSARPYLLASCLLGLFDWALPWALQPLVSRYGPV